MARTLYPNNATIVNNMGLAYALAEEKSTQAIELLKEALAIAEIDSSKKQITLNLALAYGLADNDAEAKSLLSPILSEAAIYNNLGIYASLRNDKELSRTYLSKALTSEPVFYEKAWKNLEKLN